MTIVITTIDVTLMGHKEDSTFLVKRSQVIGWLPFPLFS